jgi:formylglycine-generating enzyme required for sulfatase activity
LAVRTEEATRNAERADRERARFEVENERFRLLRYQVTLDDALREADALRATPEEGPDAWVDLIPDLERWIAERDRPLRTAQAEVRSALLAMIERVGRPPEEVEARIRTYRAESVEPLRLELQAWQRAVRLARRQRAGELEDLESFDRRHADELATTLDALDIDPEQPAELQVFVWGRAKRPDVVLATSGVDVRTWGEEHLALAAGRAAMRRMKAIEHEYVGDAGFAEMAASIADTVAWAYAWNGRCDEARALAAATRQAYGDGTTYLYYQVAIDIMCDLLERGAPHILADLECRIADSEYEANVLATTAFDDDVERFLYGTLQRFEARLARFHGPSGRAAEMERTLRWARALESVSIERHAASWQAARDAILAADGVRASTLYGRVLLDLEPQLGLVPIGMNPVTRLWEFYDLRSAWDGVSDPATIEIPQHDESGWIDVTESTGIVFVLVPGGITWFGAQGTDADGRHFDPAAEQDEGPVSSFELAPYFIARHELTAAQWQRLATEDFDPRPSFYGTDTVGGRLANADGTHPVESVSWQAGHDLLTLYGLDLPTELQWEHAARAETDTPWWTGRDKESLRGAANLADITGRQLGVEWSGSVQWPDFEDGYMVHAPVDTLRANPFGLHHTVGNVTEWCLDAPGMHDKTHRPKDGLQLIPNVQTSRIYRGGSFTDGPEESRVSARAGLAAGYQTRDYGLRAARRVFFRGR